MSGTRFIDRVPVFLVKQQIKTPQQGGVFRWRKLFKQNLLFVEHQ